MVADWHASDVYLRIPFGRSLWFLGFQGEHTTEVPLPQSLFHLVFKSLWDLS